MRLCAMCVWEQEIGKACATLSDDGSYHLWQLMWKVR